MEIFHKEVDNQPQEDQRLPWRRPEFERLTIAIDTVFGSSSGPDFEGTGFIFNFDKKFPAG